MAAWFWLVGGTIVAVATRPVLVRARSGGRAGRAAPRSPRRRRPGRGVHGTAGALGRSVVVDDVEGLGGRVDQLDGPRDDAPERVAPDRSGDAAWPRAPRRERVELVVGQGDPRRRPEQVRRRPRASAPGGRSTRHLDLVERVLPVASGRGRGRRSRRSGPRSSGSRRDGGARRAAARARTSGGSRRHDHVDGLDGRGRAPRSAPAAKARSSRDRVGTR